MYENNKTGFYPYYMYSKVCLYPTFESVCKPIIEAVSVHQSTKKLRSEQRYVIKFCLHFGKTSTESTSRYRIFKWYKKF